MSVKGNIKDMAIADIIQTNCHDRKSAKLTVKQNGAMAELFFRKSVV